MMNPFESLPRQEAKRQIIDDSIRSNRKMDLVESDYDKIYDLLFYYGNYRRIEELFKNLQLSREDWYLDEKLDHIKKEVLRDLIYEGYSIDQIKALLEFTDFEPDWHDYKEDISMRYLNDISNLSIEIIIDEQEYFGIPINWNDPIVIDVVVAEYKKDLENGHYDHLRELAQLSNIKPDWEGELKSAVERAMENALDSYYENEATNLLGLIGNNIDFHGRLKQKINNKYIDCLNALDRQKIIWLEKVSGIEPDWSGELKTVVIEKYKELVMDDYFNKVTKLQKITKVAPDWKGDLKPFVIKTYGEYLDGNYCYNYEARITQLQELSGIKPDWQGELKYFVMGKYIKLVKKGDFDSITKLQEISEVKPDWEGELRQAVMVRYKKCVMYDDFDELARLQEISKVEPDWEGELRQAVMERYASYVMHDDYYNRPEVRIKALQQLSGVKPDWQGGLKQAVLGAYENFVKNGQFDSVARLQEISKVEPDWEGEFRQTVMKAYENFVKNVKFDSVAKLQEISKVEPVWKGELKPAVMEAYENFVKDVRFDSVARLQEISKVEPDWEGVLRSKVMERYCVDISFGRFDRITKLQELSGIVPDWEGELKPAVLGAYENFVKNGPFDSVARLQEISKVEPDWEGEFRQTVMKKYKDLVINGYYDDIAKLQKLSGIVPDWEGELKPKVMKKYGEYTVNRDFDRIAKFQELSGMVPDWEGELRPKVMEAYKEFVMYGDTYAVAKLQEISKIEPDWKGELRQTVLETYKEFAINGNIDAVAKLQEISNVTPNWEGELRYSVYCKYTEFCVSADMAKIKQFEEFTNLRMDDAIKLELFWKAIVKHRKIKTLEFIENNYGDQQVEWLKVFELALRKSYHELLKAALSDSAVYDFVNACITRYKIKPDRELVSALFLNINSANAFDRLLQLIFLCGYKNLGKLTVNQIKGKKFTMRQVAIMQSLELIPDGDEEKREFMDSLNQGTSDALLVAQLLLARNVPSPAKRAEYCSWHNELEPLIRDLQNKFDLNDNERIFAFIDYIQKFGMKNLPLLASVSMNLYLLRNKLAQGKGDDERFEENIGKFVNSEVGIHLQQFIDAHSMGIDLKSINKPADVDGIFMRLQNMMKELKEKVLNDVMPNALEQSPIDMELFNSIMVRSGSWAENDHGYSRETLIAKWRKYTENNPVTLPDYFEQKTYLLKARLEKSLADELKALDNMSEESNKIIDLKNQKREQILQILQREEYTAYLAPYHTAFDEAERLGELVADPKIAFFTTINNQKDKLKKLKEQFETISDAPENAKKKAGMQIGIQKQEVLLQSLKRFETVEGIKEVIIDAVNKKEQEIAEIEKDKERAVEDLPVLEEELKKINSSMEDDDVNPEKKKEQQRITKEIQKIKSKLNLSTESLQKDAEKLRAIIDKLEQELRPNEKEYLVLQAMIAGIANAFDQKTAISIFGDSLRLISARMTMHESEAHVRFIREAHKEADIEKEYMAWRTFFQEQLVQHFIDPDYADQPRVVAFSKESIDLLESVWRLNNIREKSMEVLSGTSKDVIKHPFLKTVTDVKKIESEIEALETEGLDALAEKIAVTYSPCHGLGRIFAGDVGDACYTSQRNRFADGEYPNLHAIILSQRDKKSEDIKLLGSVLLIEGKDVNGKKYLFARAVNPIDSVIKRQINAEEFLQGLLDYLKTTAEKAGFDEAVLCVDTKETRSGSNRKEMFEAMEKAARDNKWPIADQLEQTPETTFKYDVWNTQFCRVYRIWQKEK
jgi:hypothetical protein